MKHPATTVLITGANRGLGREAIRYVSSRGAFNIVLAGRNEEEMEAVAAGLRSDYQASVRLLTMDVSSLQSVRAAAQTLLHLIEAGETGPLSAVVLNAGMQSSSKAAEYSVDGFEMTFATNCLGPFLLMNLLLDDIRPGGRVVWTASGTHDPATADGKVVGKAAAANAQALATTGRRGDPLAPGVRYTTSKLCVVLYSHELHRRLREAGHDVSSIAYDPGYVPETGLTRSAPAMVQWISKTKVFKALFGLFGGTLGDLAFSGAGLGHVAVDPEYAGAAGKYIQSKSLVLHEARSSRASYDVQSANQLWIDSARLVQLTAGEAPACIDGPRG